MTEGKEHQMQAILESLESIKKHLDQQDTDNKANTWATTWISLITVGFSITLVGVIQAVNATANIMVGYGIVLTVVFAIFAIIQRTRRVK
jgi:hypothetical protein